MKAYLYLDVETTGLNPATNDVIQIACIPMIDGVEHDHFNEFCQPTNWNAIEEAATRVHGITRERMATFQSPQEMVDKLVRFLSKYQTKFILAGYNTNFDKSFVGSLFSKAGRSKDYATLFSSEIRDVFVRAKAVKDKIKSTKFKLVNLAEEFGIEINAHEALSDIQATILVDKKIAELAGEEFVEISVNDDVVKLGLPELPQLHIHSEYSNTDSVVSVEDWAYWAYKNNVSAIAFPDHNWAASLHKSINKQAVIDRIKKTHKVEVPHEALNIIPAISINTTFKKAGVDSVFRLNAWAIDNKGYFNLIKLASLGWDTSVEDSDFTVSVTDIRAIKPYTEGVIFGSACERGIVGTILESKDMEQIEEIVKSLKKELGSLVMELLPFDALKYFSKGIGFRSYARSENGLLDGNLTGSVNVVVADLVDRCGMDFMISSASHYIDPDDKILQDVVSKSSFKDKRFFYDSRHQRSLDEQYAILKRHLGSWMSVDRIHQARDTAERIASKAAGIKIKHEFHLPRIEIPDNIASKTDDYDKQLYYFLMAKIKEHNRWSDDPVYVARFKKELDVIWKNSKLNFLPYFLMYEDICAYARASGILQNLARGSAGGCLISYYLKIIHIDPIKEKLPFERFLSHARINVNSFPDIDLDLGNRTPVLKYLMDKYKMGFAQIGTFQKFKTKNALKDAMFAIFGRSRTDREVMDVCDTIPDSPQGLDESHFLYGYTDSEGIYHKGNIEGNDVLRNFFKQYPEIEHITRRLIGLPKGMGRHASAFVISTLAPGCERVPTMIFHDEELGPVPVTQFEAPMVEKSGLVKADILGLTTIKTIENVVELIKKNTGTDLLEEDDHGVQMLYRLPEDPKVYEDFYRRKTDSSFQFNTDLIKGYIQQFAPVCRKDLADLTALCRPGALDVEFIPGVSATQFYIDVRNGNREPEYIHPDLAEILSETNGVVTYQEQLMEILVKFCGYTLEESDQIRSAIAKKKRDVMVKAFEKIRIETNKHGWTLEQAEELCKVIEAYSNYSFNRSHSCLAPTQEVMTPSGVARVCDLKPGDLVMGATADGPVVCAASNVWVVGHKQVYEVQFDDDSIINMTKDHMIATTLQWSSIENAFKNKLEIVSHEFKNKSTLKIKSMKPIGKMPVYDIEVPDTRNFILGNGVIAHNCAYGHLGYITMYLKRNFPLEWWSAELNNSDEAKTRHYVSVLGDKIIPPSIRNPSDKFTIVGDRIAAPLTTIKGLGPASIRSIIAKGPYDSVEGFVTRGAGAFNSSHFWALLKAGVFDEFAESHLSIPESRQNIITYFQKLKKIKTLPAEVADLSPLSMFLSQRDIYKCFNKAILDDVLIRHEISEIWPAMRETSKRDIPLAFGSMPTIPVIASVAVADKLLSAHTAYEGKGIKIAMIGIYQSSEHKEGTSKSGRPWSMVKVNMSDGLSTMECVKWDQKKTYRFPVNSLVYVMGYLKRGWRDMPTIEIIEIEKVEPVDTRKKRTP